MALRIARLLIGLAVCAGLLPCRTLAEGSIRTLILTGESTPQTRNNSVILRSILEASGLFEVRISEVPLNINAEALSGFDLVVDNGLGCTSGSQAERAIAGFVASGKGLVVAHDALRATDAPPFWPVSRSGNRSASVSFVDVSLTGPDHPITRGMAVSFRMADAVPPGLVARPGAETIATVGKTSGETSTPVVLVSRSMGGRVVSVALGHDASAVHETSFRVLFARSAEWAATGSVTLPPRPVSTSGRGLRGLIITGGHDHHAAFYSLFGGHAEFERLPVDTAANAFTKDLRDRFDVLILYDFTRDLDEPRRKNLREFVEAGKGIVVLHHALLDFQKWAWWSEEVVGGRYRLQREGTSPSSTVKDDQELFVSSVGEHPVLRGLEPFHITDEAYKNLWMSDRIVPLLTTDNPTSDRNLAWIGPSKTARVVAIQLGHGPSAFGHPCYRLLVRNAVLWASGKSR